jgi:hypothetical protein
LFTQYNENIKPHVESKAMLNFIGGYFLLISTLFYFLWLSEIGPAIINNTVPKSISDAGLFTNAVHVIDLSVILPGIFITGVLLLRRNTFGILLAPVMLTFFILMDITIGFLVLVMKIRGIGTDLTVTVAMVALAVLSLGLLIWFFRNQYFTAAAPPQMPVQDPLHHT